MAQPVIKVRNLEKSYGKNHVLRGIDLDAERDTMLALLGPNGAKKTTTVRVLSTLLQPDGGDVSIEGNDVNKCIYMLKTNAFGFHDSSSPNHEQLRV